MLISSPSSKSIRIPSTKYIMLINKLTEESYLFFPKGEDIKIGKGAKCARFIFDGSTEFDDFEKNHIKHFRDYQLKNLKKKYTNVIQQILELPDSKLLRYLLACECKYKETKIALKNHLVFTESLKSCLIDDEILSFLRSGQLYIYGRDKNFRPIVVFSAKKFKIEDGINEEKLIKCFTYFFEYLMNNLLIPGQVENWVQITDLKDTSLWSIPYKKLGELIKFAQSSYRSRLFRAYVVNAPGTVTMAWSMAKKFMSPVSASKVDISGKNYSKRMWEHINKDQIEQKYGGTAPNLEPPFIEPEQIWPPKATSYNFMLPNDKPSERQIDYKTYYDKYINGLLDWRVSMDIINKYKSTLEVTTFDTPRSLDTFTYIDEKITKIDMNRYKTPNKSTCYTLSINEESTKIYRFPQDQDDFDTFINQDFCDVDEYYTKLDKVSNMFKVQKKK